MDSVIVQSGEMALFERRLNTYQNLLIGKTYWIGVDLDGTLAHWDGSFEIGKPIPKMVARIKEWIAAGVEVRIFTARACEPEMIPIIQQWLVQEAGLPALEVTNQKDYDMLELWDDRAVAVKLNTGDPCGVGPLTD